LDDDPHAVPRPAQSRIGLNQLPRHGNK
jgi:hypothetical protein